MNIWGIVLLAIGITSFTFIVISRTFQCLIRKNIIKPSKISKIFYHDDEMFINSWRKTQEEGILKFIIKNAIAVIVMVVIIGKITNLYRTQSETLFGYLLTGVISSLIIIPILWSENQNKYNKLKEKRNIEDDNINNGNKKN